MKEIKIRKNLGAVFCVLAAVLASGCSNGGNGNDNQNSANTNDNSTANTNDNDNFAPPTDFENAEFVSFSEADIANVEADIADDGEIDIYSLGTLNAGDRLDVLCVAPENSSLDPMIALFDGSGQRVLWNDDINAQTTNFDSAFDGNIRHEDHYFLAVTSTAFHSTSGDYQLTVQRFSDVDSPVTQPQTVMLNWAAADNVSVGGRDYGDLPALDDSFPGQAEQIKSLILEKVQEDFSDFNVTIITSDNETADTHFSRIYFSPDTDMSAYGRSDGVDFYNGNDMDNGIVFIGQFAGLTTQLDEMAQAMANIVSREIGALLGLMPTDDSSDLMHLTEAFAAGSLLDDRSFKTADLIDFPIGQQNSTLLLEETVGRQ